MNHTKGVIVLALAAWIFVLSGCALYHDSVVVYGVPGTGPTSPVGRDEGDRLVLVAVCGGGSRASLWHAAVMKELYRQVKLPDGRSIVDEIDYISSVSGGSLSSAYWCLKKPDLDSRDTKSYDAFFEKYLAAMRVNIEAKMAGTPFTWYRFLVTPEDRAVVLKRTFDKLYFDHRTFAELADRERRGVSPVLIANGTDMDTGAKFLFTNLPRTEFEPRPPEFTERLVGTFLAEHEVLFGGDVLGVVTPADVGISISDMEVSRAAAASASVPLLLGPVVLKDNLKSTPEKPVYVHVNDGAVNDNQGLVTLIDLLFGRVEHEGKKFKGALIILVDANPYVDPRFTDGKVRAFKTIEMVERAFFILFHEGKAFVYLTIFDILKKDPRFGDVTILCLSPYLADDRSISETFTKTPTRFKITPAQADAIERAAGIVVEKLKGKMLEEMEKGSKR